MSGHFHWAQAVSVLRYRPSLVKRDRVDAGGGPMIEKSEAMLRGTHDLFQVDKHLPSMANRVSGVPQDVDQDIQATYPYRSFLIAIRQPDSKSSRKAKRAGLYFPVHGAEDLTLAISESRMTQLT
ncbi:uncharacterized protein MCYG_07866 [Microsporum canis CBS 113480]|uniref:Uncharacterized protein n=1 Tax=Arthroderma otae (strain ATCC MYA-4605 / CBS 113480) TaxID=554155 RepID=C5FXK7_ARTOC|nr:uncharacterized protein MCYG_07866 [Microsporum canis CBS 113480]EEQ35047.1 predicted protein [Microsporum canis CBS 113480]